MGTVRSYVDELRGLAIQTGNSRQERGVLSSIPGQGASLANLIEPAHRLDVVDLIRVQPRTAAKPSRSELWKCRGCGKRGKPTAGFPLFPRAPWKSRQEQARFPHFHSSGDEGGWKSGKPKAGFPLSHRPE